MYAAAGRDDRSSTKLRLVRGSVFEAVVNSR
jgi:hypothetical protein